MHYILRKKDNDGSRLNIRNKEIEKTEVLKEKCKPRNITSKKYLSNTKGKYFFTGTQKLKKFINR